MAKQIKPAPASKQKTTPSLKQNLPLFGKENYRWMLVGLVGILLGLLLMIGGKSKDPNVFDPSQVYSFRRITVAPILILAGLALEIVGIFKNPKASKPQ
jgi:hypothetical protein